jgi:hypothetical protein
VEPFCTVDDGSYIGRPPPSAAASGNEKLPASIAAVEKCLVVLRLDRSTAYSLDSRSVRSVPHSLGNTIEAILRKRFVGAKGWAIMAGGDLNRLNQVSP